MELGDIMTKMDRDGNNTVDFEEFYYWCVCLSKAYVQIMSQAMFHDETNFCSNCSVLGTLKEWRPACVELL